MPFKDPEQRKIKQAEYSRNYYEKNRSKVITAVNKNKKANRVWFAAYKRTLACTDCGENHPATLDFHHVIHDKNHRKVNDLVSDGHAKPRIMEEIKKCVVLCSNCHRKHHHEERIHKRNLAKKKKRAKIHTTNTHKGNTMGKPMQNLMKYFKGAESKKEEKAEKKLSPKAYAKGEKMEGEKPAVKKPVAKAKK